MIGLIFIKRKKIVILIMLIILIICGGSVLWNSLMMKNTDKIDSNLKNEKNMLEMEVLSYMHYIQTFIPVTIQDIEKMLQEDSFYLYTGRITCEWCRKLVPILSQVAASKGKCIYYLDSEDTDSNQQLKEFREKYEIKSVPSLIYFNCEGTYKRIEVDFDSNSLNSNLNESMIY